VIFPVSFAEEKEVTLQKVVSRAWVDVGTIKAEIWPLKKASATNTDGIGLPYKNSHKIFTKADIGLNMRIVDGTNKYLISEPQDWTSHREAFLSLVIMDDLVNITRKQNSGGQLPSGGSAASSTISVADSLSCYLVPDKGNVVVVSSGQTSINYMKMFCDMTDIKENDIVTDLNTESKYKVINVKQYTQVCYTYAYLQGGVVQ